MKKNLFYTIAILVFCCLIILVFTLFTEKEERNSFNRKIVNKNLNIIGDIELPSSSFEFVRGSKNTLALREINAFSNIYLVKPDFSGIKVFNMKLPHTIVPANVSMFNLGIKDSLLYLTGYESGKFSTISKRSGRRTDYQIPRILIDHSSLLSNESIVGRGFFQNNNQPETELIKINYINGEIRNTFTFNFKKGNAFSNDGVLRYDSESSKLLYMYYYKGEFLCLDTNLKTRYIAKTIDTISTSINSVVNIGKETNQKKENITTQTKPTKVINKSFTLYDDYLYLASTLKGDNETSTNFRNNQVIDVYLLKNGKYLYSFYIPNFKRKKLREFIIQDGLIYGLFGNYLIKLQINV